jgi:hypothetical protein
MSEQYDALVAKYRAARAARDERRKAAEASVEVATS